VQRLAEEVSVELQWEQATADDPQPGELLRFRSETLPGREFVMYRDRQMWVRKDGGPWFAFVPAKKEQN
jgi:hypothetical protein